MLDAHLFLAFLRLMELLLLFGIGCYLTWTVPPAQHRVIRLAMCGTFILINIAAILVRVFVLKLEPW